MGKPMTIMGSVGCVQFKVVTDKDFALRKKIEEVVQWRPEAGGPLEGTPEDLRFKYIKYDWELPWLLQVAGNSAGDLTQTLMHHPRLAR